MKRRLRKTVENAMNSRLIFFTPSYFSPTVPSGAAIVPWWFARAYTYQ